MARIGSKPHIALQDGQSPTQKRAGGKRVLVSSRGRKLVLYWLAPVLAAAMLLTGVGQDIAFADDGDLDPTFGGDGKVTTGLGSINFTANAVAIQPNGKIVAVGTIDGGSYENDFFVARYNTDGSLDGSFGSNGLHIIDFGSDSDKANAVAIQADGKIVVAGSTKVDFIYSDFAIARLNTDGSNDTTFSGDGKTTTDFVGDSDAATSVTIQSNGKIVAAGYAFIQSYAAHFALVRYNIYGSLDTTFDEDGKVTMGIGGHQSAVVNGMAIQSNGKIVVAGYGSPSSDPTLKFIVARFNTDGSYDTTFMQLGVYWYPFDEGDAYANAVAIQSNGKIVVAGYVAGGSFALVRVNTDGSLDTTFDGDGKVTTSFGSILDRANGVAIQSDGKIVAAGRTSTHDQFFDFALARYNTNGSLDTTFGGDGKVTTDFAQSDEEANGMAIQSDGKIVAAGRIVFQGTESTNIAVARYQSGETPSPTPTRTPQPTQTPGGPSATPVPSDTATATPPVQITPTLCPIQFTDVPSGSTFYSFIRCLACRSIVSGYSDGSFKPNNNVIRGQLSKIVSNAAAFSDPQPNQLFEDVPVPSTFQLYIGRLASRGYISGYTCGGDGEPCGVGHLPYFRPNNNATRGQIAKIDANAAGYNEAPVGQTFEDVAPGSVFYTFTQRLTSRTIMAGYACGGVGEPCIPPDNRPYFRPNNNATRGQTSKIVANTFMHECDLPTR